MDSAAVLPPEPPEVGGSNLPRIGAVFLTLAAGKPLAKSNGKVYQLTQALRAARKERWKRLHQFLSERQACGAARQAPALPARAGRRARSHVSGRCNYVDRELIGLRKVHCDKFNARFHQVADKMHIERMAIEFCNHQGGAMEPANGERHALTAAFTGGPGAAVGLHIPRLGSR